jgi:hypothetical protein
MPDLVHRTRRRLTRLAAGYASSLKSLVQLAAGALGYQIIRIDRPRLRRTRATNDPILLTAKAHLTTDMAPPVDLPPLGERWTSYAWKLRSAIHSIGSSEDLLAFAQSGQAGVETHLSGGTLKDFCHWWELSMAAVLPAELYDARISFRSPPMTPTRYQIEIGGRTTDFVTICAGNDILSMLHWLGKDRPRTVCDIGGGTGKYAHAWLTNFAHRPDLITILDIPETLVYSETLLRSVFGDDAVQYVASPGMVPNKSGIVLCPINNIYALAGTTFDLVTNIGSMQEMTDTWIDFYMKWLDNQPCRFFYSNNFFANALASMKEGHNSWSPRPSPRWRLRGSRIILGMRNGANLLFERDSPIPANSPPPDGNGAEGWLSCLERVRMAGDEATLRNAVDFASTQLPFTPKETWHVAKLLAKLTGHADDAALFDRLDSERRGGIEGTH